ncbi:MAG TPA: TadE/TadG family type IV pilus assembly protein [Pirellulales bacterium]|jgi:Flp pilus assembly protein TadG|nr:TadE/TadG family type IV pilus assembly protein [Pirellulales bacterium]
MIRHTDNTAAARHRRRGSTLVEAALVLPIVLMFIMGIMEYGRYLMTLHLFDNAAREGCRYAIAHIQPVTLGGTTYGDATSNVTSVITSFLAGQTLSNQQTQVYLSDSLGNNIGTWTNGTAGQSVCVQITGNYKVSVMTLLGLPSSLPITSTAVMDCEVQ